MGNYAYLVCVQAQNKETGEEINNNKFYEMKENDDGTFTCEYGRIGGHTQTKVYPISKWESTFKQKTSKVRNGYIYKDMTHLKAEKKSVGFSDVDDNKIQKLLDTLMSYSKHSMAENYTVSSEAVTKQQVEEAQTILNVVANYAMYRDWKKHISIINDELQKLFAVIPRKMKKVQDHLISKDATKKDAQKLVSDEQSTLDVMAQQVDLNVSSDKDDKQTLANALGITIDHINDEQKQEILDLMGPNAHQFKNAWLVKDSNQCPKFENYRHNEAVKKWSKLLWHGSRNENWLNILKTGLLIRPAGVVLTGAMFGNGIYFADKCQKSVGYTSLRGSYWASGSSNQAFLALYAVNTGMELRHQQHQSWMYNLDENNLKSKGDYDSLFAEGGIDLRNNEYIVYNQNQCTIKYLVEIGD